VTAGDRRWLAGTSRAVVRPVLLAPQRPDNGPSGRMGGLFDPRAAGGSWRGAAGWHCPRKQWDASTGWLLREPWQLLPATVL